MAANDQLIVAAILVAAGDGRRLGTDVPKAFVQVAGRTLLEHAASQFLTHPAVRDVVVVAPAALVEAATALVPSATVVTGGRQRQESVARGLAAVRDDVDAVLVHDVARPFVPATVISRVVVALAGGARAVVPVVPVVDTVKRVDAHGRVTATLERAELRAVQTPQGFTRAVALAAHGPDAPADAPDDGALAERIGVRVIVVDGDDDSFKITRPRDLALAEYVASQ